MKKKKIKNSLLVGTLIKLLQINPAVCRWKIQHYNINAVFTTNSARWDFNTETGRSLSYIHGNSKISQISNKTLTNLLPQLVDWKRKGSPNPQLHWIFQVTFQARISSISTILLHHWSAACRRRQGKTAKAAPQPEYLGIHPERVMSSGHPSYVFLSLSFFVCWEQKMHQLITPLLPAPVKPVSLKKVESRWVILCLMVT